MGQYLLQIKIRPTQKQELTNSVCFLQPSPVLGENLNGVGIPQITLQRETKICTYCTDFPSQIIQGHH